MIDTTAHRKSELASIDALLSMHGHWVNPSVIEAIYDRLMAGPREKVPPGAVIIEVGCSSVSRDSPVGTVAYVRGEAGISKIEKAHGGGWEISMVDQCTS